MSRLTLIARAVAKETGVSVADMLSEHRARPIAYARFMAWLVADELTGLSLPKIAHGFQKKDHTTVMHGIARAKELRQTCPKFAKQFEAAKKAARENVERPRPGDDNSEAIIRVMIERYQSRLRIMAQTRPAKFYERFGNTVTA